MVEAFYSISIKCFYFDFWAGLQQKWSPRSSRYVAVLLLIREALRHRTYPAPLSENFIVVEYV